MDVYLQIRPVILICYSFHSRYFFLVFTGLIVLGLFNGLIFLPVLLVLVGPPAEVIPNDNSDSISPPSPEPSKTASAYHKHSTSRGRSSTRSNPLHSAAMSQNKGLKISASDLKLGKNRHHQSDLSLSTIAEESGSYASQNTCSGGQNGGSGYDHNTFPMTSQSLNGTSVFVEPHVVVETTTYPSTSLVSLNIFRYVFNHVILNQL